MNVMTAAQMKEIDNKSINTFNIPEIVLMENAGLCCLKILKFEFPIETCVAVVCGKGNNAGDGFVIARYLKLSGYNVVVCALVQEESLSDSALTNYLILKKQYPELIFHVNNKNEIVDLIKNCDLVVDAIFGTGLSSNVKGFFETAINAINESVKKVFSIDIPSGVNSDSGEIMGCAVKSDITVTIGAIKQGLLLPPASGLTGKIYIADIGFPKELTCGEQFKIHVTSFEDVFKLLPKRNMHDHKYSSGSLLIISGSKNYTGAPVLCAKSALNSGCGMVYLSVPDNIHPIIANKVNEAVVLPYELNSDGDIPSKIADLLMKIDAVVIGPGLSNDKTTTLFVEKILKNTSKPVVLDASALQLNLLKQGRNIIITPHTGEMAKIFEKKSFEIEEQRILYAKRASEDFNAVTVLKGALSIISSQSGDIYFNTSGNRAMASGGMGDVLSGIIGAFAAKKVPVFESAFIGAFIHGLAGDMVAKYSSYVVTAGEVINRIPEVLDSVYKEDIKFAENNQKIKTVSIWQ